jgi:hypothetical protein
MKNEANNNATAAVVHNLQWPSEEANTKATDETSDKTVSAWVGPLVSQLQHRISTRKQVAHAPCLQLDLSLVQQVLHLRSDHQYAPWVVLTLNCGGTKTNCSTKISAQRKHTSHAKPREHLNAPFSKPLTSKSRL